MNTVFSDQRIEQWKADGPQYRPMVINHTHTFQASPNVVFPLLCLATEFD